jgi:flagellin-like hook-associated protein FlgL
MWRRLITAFVLGCAAAGAGRAQASARPAADPNKFAVIVSGASGDEEFAKRFAQWTKELRRALVERLSFDEARVTLLTESPEGGGALRASAEELRRAFASLRAKATPESTVFVFLIGHGTFDGRAAKFSLVGPDLSAAEYAGLLGELPARRVVVFNMASASGEFIKPLSGKGRVVVTATRSGQEQNATRFPEHFIAALGSREADADQNGRVSVLEAFDYAARMTAEQYKRAGRLATEHALIDDSGDGVGHPSAEGGDGAVARNVYLDSLSTEQAAAGAETNRLLRERERLEVEVEQLKARKSQLAEAAYEAELERLFVSLAKVNRSIKRGGR